MLLPLKVCWMCLATKGAEDMALCMTHVGSNAPWWGTMLQTDPWTTSPSYSKLTGFSVPMIMGDLLHIWNLGVARDLLGSSLKIIMTEQEVFPGANLKDRFAAASESLKLFAKQHRLPLRMRKLKQSKVVWNTRKYPELCSSGYDSFVLGSWLQHVLEQHQHRYPELYSMLWTSNRAVSLVYSAGRFLTPSEKATLETLGDCFTHVYMKMANEAVREHKLLFRVRPKFHLLCHIFRSTRWVNPAFYATWLEEDALKKFAKVLGLVALQTAPKRLLQRWMLSLPENLKRILGESSTDWMYNHGPAVPAQR